jgi:IS5 family transposase
VVEIRHQQRSFGDGLIHQTVEQLWKTGYVMPISSWQMMSYWKRSITRCNGATSAAGPTVGRAHLRRWYCACRLLKHIRNWSFVVLEREVRGNLLDREFTRVGAEKMPDAKTHGIKAG